MDPVGAPFINDVQSPTHRQSILGSFLRVRPRGSSQSHQTPPQLPPHSPPADDQQQQLSNPVQSQNMPPQPPSPGPGHRRRPAAGGMQTSSSHGFNVPPINSGGGGGGVGGLSQILRRRRSANGVLNSTSLQQQQQQNPQTQLQPQGTTNNGSNTLSMNPSPPVLAARPATTATAGAPPNLRSHRIRLVPHLDSNRSLHFEPIMRDVSEGGPPLRIGRFTDRSGMGVAALNAQSTNKLAFKSKVVSRAHAVVWCEPGGNFFLKDTKSSSGTFLNHIRLSTPNTESRAFPLKDGDILQLGVDYQGGTEEIYKCVKIRIELGREWQAHANAFNTNALKQLKALSGQIPIKAVTESAIKPPSNAKTGLSDCCICLFSVTVNQSLFIAPCSHIFHYKCIRPMLLLHHPGFSCPLCRTFANLEEDVEVENDQDAAAGDGESDSASGGDSGVQGPTPPLIGIARTAVANDGMDVDNNFLAMIPPFPNGNGAETEVERDNIAGETLRSRGNLRRSTSTRNPEFASVPEAVNEHGVLPEDEGYDADGAIGVEYDADRIGEDIHDSPPLPPLPVPAPGLMGSSSGALPLTSQSHILGQLGIGISRPMSVPVNAVPSQGSNPGRGSGRVPVDDFSDGDGDGGYIRDLEGSGSSGDGADGPLAGGKRKR